MRKHDDQKDTQKMVADQLLKSLDDYSTKSIYSLPKEIVNSIKIGTIQEGGLVQMEKEVEAKTVEKAEM